MKNLTILIMDDATVVRQLIVKMLIENINAEQILQAGDTTSAIELFAQHKPQIAILDIQVPGDRNGIDVLRIFKTLMPLVAVIMLTNHATMRYRLECKRAGADFFFDKSAEFEKLNAVVAELIERLPH
ncbi:MAG: response regulator transcription factor [Chloroflexi bacterium]|nr:response regulator transcription factor [Chloroflexota bacterium]